MYFLLFLPFQINSSWTQSRNLNTRPVVSYLVEYGALEKTWPFIEWQEPAGTPRASNITKKSLTFSEQPLQPIPPSLICTRWILNALTSVFSQCLIPTTDGIKPCDHDLWSNCVNSQIQTCCEVSFVFLLGAVWWSDVGITSLHGSPSSTGTRVQHNDLSGCLSLPVSVPRLNMLERLTSCYSTQPCSKSPGSSCSEGTIYQHMCSDFIQIYLMRNKCRLLLIYGVCVCVFTLSLTQNLCVVG